MAKYYPVNLNLEKKDCLVVGGGAVAERKIRRLLEYGAKVTVVSPKFNQGIIRLSKQNKILIYKHHVNLRDIVRRFLVISATGERRINSLVSQYCKESDILVNVVDSPGECNFILPSVVRKGDLTISISTDGIAPALAKKIRGMLEKKFGVEYAKLLKIMKKIRPRALKKIKNTKLRRIFFEKAVNYGIVQLLKRGQEKQVKEKLEQILEDVR